MAFTLITGASHGIGKSLAEKCAKMGKDLVLIALPGSGLCEMARSIQEDFSVKVKALGIDLTEEGAPKKVFDFCEANHISIDALLSNAGFGRGGLFENTPLPDYQAMMKLNNHAMVELTFHFMEQLKTNAPSHIMYTSSMEATLPLPYKATYTATKAFIYAFALALREELRPANVQVSVLCPGSTLTNEDGLKRIHSMGKKAKYMVSTPEFVAEFGLRGLYRGKAVIIPGKINRMVVKCMRMMPTLWKMRILERFFRVYKDQ